MFLQSEKERIKYLYQGPRSSETHEMPASSPNALTMGYLDLLGIPLGSLFFKRSTKELALMGPDRHQ